MRDQPRLEAPGLAFVAQRLRERYGLSFADERRAELERAIVRAARACRADPASFLQRLARFGSIAEWDALVCQATVGETHFFRESACFDALRGEILPAIVARRRAANDLRLRIWSAACSTGEEPYSVAMLLDSMLPDAEAWSITILGTDVNRDSLRMASAARYREWSFRGTEAIRAKYFTVCADGRHELAQRVRRRVTFAYLNLAADSYPAVPNGTCDLDVILCRNVLMYFDTATAAATVQRLQRALHPEGWLAVSAAETLHDLYGSLSRRRIGESIWFQDGGRASPESATALGTDAGAASFDLHACGKPTRWLGSASYPDARDEARSRSSVGVAPHRASANAHDAVQQRAAGSDDHQHAIGDLLAGARAHADKGELALALEWSDRALARDPLAAEGHYLRGVIEAAQGHADAAIAALERAIFLAPDHVMAMFSLAVLELARGQRAKSRRLFAATLRLTRGLAPHHAVPGAEGLTVERIGAMVRDLDAAPSVGGTVTAAPARAILDEVTRA